MQSRISPAVARFLAVILFASAPMAAFAQAPATDKPVPVVLPIPRPEPAVAVPAQVQQPPLELLVWDATQKEQTTVSGQATADFVFNVSNPTETSVQIDDVRTSCGCTVAKLPSKPWVLVPHTNGQIGVSVNLAGKSGTFSKIITVLSSNDQKALIIQVHMPDNPEMMRLRNSQIAQADPQAVLRGDCAACHAAPTAGLMGKELYIKACGICHEAKPRATMVTDLHNLTHPTDYAYWKTIITHGKPPTMMPAFGIEHGGPLTDVQIESLARTLTQAFPSRMQGTPPQQSAAVTPTTTNTFIRTQMVGVPRPVNN